MKTETFNIPSIHCGNCVNTIQMEVGEIEGVTAVTASNETKQVEVSFEAPATSETIIALLAEINFPAE